MGDGFVVPSELDAATSHDDAGADPTLECSDGTTRPCQIDLGTHAGIHDCAAGTMVCESGRWSLCYPD
jgi:hypothetical protein